MSGSSGWDPNQPSNWKELGRRCLELAIQRELAELGLVAGLIVLAHPAMPTGTMEDLAAVDKLTGKSKLGIPELVELGIIRRSIARQAMELPQEFRELTVVRCLLGVEWES